MRNKKGDILMENLIFIILNVVFLGILILFLINQGNGVIFLERSSAKQISLLIDSASPNSILKLNFEKALEMAEENGISKGEVIKIDNEKNTVTVSLKEESYYTYHFFNEVNVDHYPDKDGIYYIFTIGESV